MSLGFLTLATPDDYLKAVGLALSLRVSNPGVPIAVACSPAVRPLVSPHFDVVVDEEPSLRGFIHKLYLDRYSPFEETFFFDSDVLVFRAVSDVIKEWREQPYVACGNYVTGGVSPFGLDRDRVLKMIGRDRLVHIDGAGHAYFRKPECHAVFDLARNIAANYRHYAGGDIRFADEDVIDIAMTILDLKPIPHGEFFSRYFSGKPGTVAMNAAQGECSFDSVALGRVQHPHMMHFAADEAPFVYLQQLRKLFKKFGVSTNGLLNMAMRDYYRWHIAPPLKGFAKRMLKLARPAG
jgi:hypothetical protein